MSAVLMSESSIWRKPEPDAPGLQFEAHTYLMSLLSSVAVDLPEILTRPEVYNGKEIVQRVLAVSLRQSASDSIRSATITLLHVRLREKQPDLPAGVLLPPVDARNALSGDFGFHDSVLSLFTRHLEDFISKLGGIEPTRDGEESQKTSIPTGGSAGEHASSAPTDGAPLEGEQAQPAERAPSNVEVVADKDAPIPAAASPTADPSLQSLAPEVRAGLLVALLVLRCGQTDQAVLDLVLAKLKDQVSIAGPWAWIDVRSNPNRATTQLRRVFMDPLSVGAFVRAAAVASELGISSASDGTPPRNLARRYFRALLKEMECKELGEVGLTLKMLCDAKSDWLHINSVPLLSSYASGSVVASSLSVDQWLRIIGCEVPEAPKEPAPESDGEIPLHQITNVPETLSADMQLNAGDMESDLDSVIVKIRKILASPPEDWATGLAGLRDAEIGDKNHPWTSGLVAGWFHHLTTARNKSGSRLSHGSIRYLRGIFANRALTFLPSRLDDLDADQLTEHYMELVEDAGSTSLRHRLAAALRQFDRYVREIWGLDTPLARLPGFGAASQEVSALILVEAEYFRIRTMTQDGSMAYRSSRQALEDRIFFMLGFRFGLRRSEILGLRAGDIRLLSTTPVLLVRDNAWRTLKTRNGVRTVPLVGLTEAELKDLAEILSALKPEQFVFFPDDAPTANGLRDHPVVPRVRALLRRISGSGRALHPHSLRHSFATLTIFGPLAEDLRLEGSPYLEPWMQASIASSSHMMRKISGSLHERGGRGSATSMVAGHGSEMTTFEHYVHLLDLLVFLACNTQLMLERQSSAADLTIRRGEARLVNAMLGFNDARGVASVGLTTTLATYARKYPKHLQLVKRGNPKPGESAIAETLFTVDDLRGDAPDESAHGYPNEKAKAETVALIAARLSRAAHRDRAALIKLLHDWVHEQTAEEDWASFPAARVGAWLRRCKRLLPDTPTSVMWDCYDSNERRYSRNHVKGDALRDAIKLQRGTFRVRIEDTRPGAESKRKRTQASVTWTIKRFLALLAAQP